MPSTILSDATVITIDQERRVLVDAAIHVVDDRIAGIGSTQEIVRRVSDAERIDCSHLTLIPGLINTHSHLFQTLLKGLGDDLVLRDWFLRMTGVAAASLTPEDVYAGARHGCVESIRGGTTTLVDFMYAHSHPELTDAVVRAYLDTGIRGIVARGCMTVDEGVGIPEPLIETVEAYVSDAERVIRSYDGKNGRIRIGLAPCMIWSVDIETLEATRELADRTGSLITMHISETPFELQTSQERFGMPELDVLDRTGVLGPDLLAVHCVYSTRRDIRILKASGASVSHNPASNLYLASGIAPIPDMLMAGVPIGLAADGPASNNNHSMIQALKFCALSHKGYHRDATVITAEKTLEMATIDAATSIGMRDEIGSLEVGKKADIVGLRLDNLLVTPLHNPVSSLVYSASGLEADLVMVNGDLVMRDAEVTTVSLEETLVRSQEQADSLVRRAGIEHLRRRPWKSISY